MISHPLVNPKPIGEPQTVAGCFHQPGQLSMAVVDEDPLGPFAQDLGWSVVVVGHMEPWNQETFRKRPAKQSHVYKHKKAANKALTHINSECLEHNGIMWTSTGHGEAVVKRFTAKDVEVFQGSIQGYVFKEIHPGVVGQVHSPSRPRW